MELLSLSSKISLFFLDLIISVKHSTLDLISSDLNYAFLQQLPLYPTFTLTFFLPTFPIDQCADLKAGMNRNKLPIAHESVFEVRPSNLNKLIT